MLTENYDDKRLLEVSDLKQEILNRITKEEIYRALQTQTKKGKSPGPRKTPIELPKSSRNCVIVI